MFLVRFKHWHWPESINKRNSIGTFGQIWAGEVLVFGENVTYGSPIVRSRALQAARGLSLGGLEWPGGLHAGK